MNWIPTTTGWKASFTAEERRTYSSTITNINYIKTIWSNGKDIRDRLAILYLTFYGSFIKRYEKQMRKTKKGRPLTRNVRRGKEMSQYQYHYNLQTELGSVVSAIAFPKHCPAALTFPFSTLFTFPSIRSIKESIVIAQKFDRKWHLSYEM